MVAKRNRKREYDRNEWETNNINKSTDKAKEKKGKEKKEDKVTSENVILMGAPQQKKEIPKVTTEAKKQTLSETTKIFDEKDSPFGKPKEKKPIETTNNEVVKNGGSHMNLGRVFFVLTALLIIFLGLGNSVNWFGAVDIDFLALWPLILIFIGLLLFKVKTSSGKVLGGLLVLAVLVLAFGILMRGGGIVNVVLSGEVLTEEREIEEFETLIFEGVGDIKVTQGEETSLLVEGDKNVLEQIVTESTDGTLTISHKSTLWNLFLFNEARVNITVTSPTYSGIYLIGSGEIKGDSIESENLSLSISGSGNIEINNVLAETLSSSILGSGDIVLSGATSRQVVSITGSGKYEAPDLSSTEAGVRISGSGDITLNVDSLLDVSITGSGNVQYIGSPKLEEGTISGSGKIQAKPDEEIQVELDPKEFYEKVKPVF